MIQWSLPLSWGTQKRQMTQMVTIKAAQAEISWLLVLSKWMLYPTFPSISHHATNNIFLLDAPFLVNAHVLYSALLLNCLMLCFVDDCNGKRGPSMLTGLYSSIWCLLRSSSLWSSWVPSYLVQVNVPDPWKKCDLYETAVKSGHGDMVFLCWVTLKLLLTVNFEMRFCWCMAIQDMSYKLDTTPCSHETAFGQPCVYSSMAIYYCPKDSIL